jgi:DNA polymerase-1
MRQTWANSLFSGNAIPSPTHPALSRGRVAPGGAVFVGSGDRDAFQLASQGTTILYPLRGGEVACIGPEEVRQRYGVDPNQVPDFIALRGDPSDKLPGAAGVGSKRAAQLVRRYGTLWWRP